MRRFVAGEGPEADPFVPPAPQVRPETVALTASVLEDLQTRQHHRDHVPPAHRGPAAPDSGTAVAEGDLSDRFVPDVYPLMFACPYTSVCHPFAPGPRRGPGPGPDVHPYILGSRRLPRPRPPPAPVATSARVAMTWGGHLAASAAHASGAALQPLALGAFRDHRDVLGEALRVLAEMFSSETASARLRSSLTEALQVPHPPVVSWRGVAWRGVAWRGVGWRVGCGVRWGGVGGGRCGAVRWGGAVRRGGVGGARWGRGGAVRCTTPHPPHRHVQVEALELLHARISLKPMIRYRHEGSFPSPQPPPPPSPAHMVWERWVRATCRARPPSHHAVVLEEFARVMASVPLSLPSRT